MRRLLVIIGLLVLVKGLLFMLAGCGVEAPPQRPAAEQPAQPGLSITGEARIGISGNL